MSTYDIAGRVIADDAPDFASALREAHGRLPRPRCLCRSDGVEMYVAAVGAVHIVKRMPDSGPLHALSCASYEPPGDLSGLGAVIGSAVRINPLDGTTSLKLDFPLSRTVSRTMPATGESPDQHDGQVGGATMKLSMLGVLHYLWSESGFHRWSPSMAGKRNWYVLRKYLLQAAQDKRIRGQPLSQMLLIPETFTVNDKDAIHRRRVAALKDGLASASAGTSTRLMLLLAEVKEVAPTRNGMKLIVKHMPDELFLLSDGLAKRVSKRFQSELELWNAIDGSHLLVLGTFSISKNGLAAIDTLTLMLTTEQWLPVENLDEFRLLEHLVRTQRRFDKCLRYNLPLSKPLASAVLADTVDPVALFVAVPDASDQDAADLARRQTESAMASWTWHGGPAEWQTLPVRRPATLDQGPDPGKGNGNK